MREDTCAAAGKGLRLLQCWQVIGKGKDKDKESVVIWLPWLCCAACAFITAEIVSSIDRLVGTSAPKLGSPSAITKAAHS
jgi:hypothetical protein